MAYKDSVLKCFPGMSERGPAQFLDLKAQFAGIKDELMQAIEDVMESQQFILGPEVGAFEASMANMVNTPYAVGCASGSDALLLALLAVGIGPEDEVITTPFTFVATAGSIVRAGAKPIFVDIQAGTFNIDPERILAAISPRTRAIIPVHLFGLAADLDPIMQIAKEHDLVVIEDAAQAIGAQYKGDAVGSLGTCGCFSFFPSKNLGGAGDGGLITLKDPSLAGRLRLLRAHGSDRKYHYELLGMNSRLDAVQAAILRVKLPYLAEWTRMRQRNAETYRRLFSEYGLLEVAKPPSVPPDHVHVYNQFVVECSKRDKLREYLTSRAIPTEVYYPQPLHLQPAFAYLGYGPGQFPRAEAASRNALALPIYSELQEEEQVAVISAFSEFYLSGTYR